MKAVEIRNPSSPFFTTNRRFGLAVEMWDLGSQMLICTFPHGVRFHYES